MSNEMVEFTSNGGTTQGYLALPEGGGKGAGIVVIQEWWGLVPHIKRVAERFAAEGFVALAPDLYHGRSTTSPDEAGKLMMALNIEQTEKDLRGAIDYLLAHERVAGETVGTVGFCMGGALSLYAATKNERVGACVVFYGGHPKIKFDLENMHAPLLGFYGERDDFATPEGARQLQATLQSLGKSAEIHIYEDADHAFFNDERPEVFNPAAAADTWQRTLRFLREHLGETA
ncbi:MAG TPA: dienelactone hydrolase family protein [Pyrinomonadaceae bacterium]|jgi:carboxymethylenebutenolidase